MAWQLRACPVCRGDLYPDGTGDLVCLGCGHIAYDTTADDERQARIAAIKATVRRSGRPRRPEPSPTGGG